MTHHITISGKRLKFLESLEVHKDLNKLADTAKIIIPGMRAFRSLEAEQFIKRGAPVTIACGYDGHNLKELEGFVSSVITEDLMIINVEDGLFKFRIPAKNQRFKDISATDLITAIVKNAGLKDIEMKPGKHAGELVFDKFTVRNVSVYEALAKIRQQTGYNIYLRGKELHVQLRHFSDLEPRKIKYDFALNVEKTSLKYIREEERLVQVEVIGITRDNQKRKVLVGQSGGDHIQVFRYNVTDKASLKAFGQEILKKYHYSGYDGKITGWLLPFVAPGDTIEVINPEYPERQGSYMVESMHLKFARSSGGVRNVGLGVSV